MQRSTTFNHETLQLDGDSFADCEFKHCRMVYAGGEPPRFDNCKFDDCEWKFEGAIYVLHAFQKKAKKGIATPQAELRKIETRLKRAAEEHATWKEQDQ
jgi:hypothetical protein